jgi:thioesterase domain-containing protein/acyl carrier protein
MTEHDMFDVARKAWQETLAAPAIDASLRWREAGADSLTSLHLLLRLEKALGRKLSFDLVDPEMTVADLARGLAATVARCPGRPARTGFLLPGVFGDEPLLANLRRALADCLRFELVELPELEHPAGVLADMAASGDHAAREIARRQPHGDIVLAGYSFGGGVAFEATRCLVAAGRTVSHLIILDTLFELHDAEPRRITVRSLVGRAAMTLAVRDELRPLILALITRFLPDEVVATRRRLLGRFRRRAIAGWRPAPTRASVVLAASDDLTAAAHGKWRGLCPDLHTIRLPCRHLDVLGPAAMAIMAPALKRAIAPLTPDPAAPPANAAHR